MGRGFWWRDKARLGRCQRRQSTQWRRPIRIDRQSVAGSVRPSVGALPAEACVSAVGRNRPLLFSRLFRSELLLLLCSLCLGTKPGLSSGLVPSACLSRTPTIISPFLG